MARGFAKAGIPVKAIAGRKKSAASDLARREGLDDCSCLSHFHKAAALGNLVVIAVPDRVISQVASRISRDGGFTVGSLVIHLSGALPAAVLDGAMASGARIGSMHPLLSFTRGKEPPPLEGALFAIEGAPDVADDLSRLVTMLGGVPVVISAESKTRYHAAAAFVSNYTVTLFGMGLSLFRKIGIPEGDGAKGLVSLLRSTIKNIEEVGIPDALTGPIARGDAATVELHVSALKEHAPELLSAYASLGIRTIDLALGKGSLAAAEAEVIKTMLARLT